MERPTMTSESMTCEIAHSQLTALQDGELTREAVGEMESHLAACTDCDRLRIELITVRERAAVWTVTVPDIQDRVMQAMVSDDQRLLLDEMRGLRAEIEGLRAEVSVLRRQLSSRTALPEWTPPTRTDYSRMENDPWSLVRS